MSLFGYVLLLSFVCMSRTVFRHIEHSLCVTDCSLDLGEPLFVTVETWFHIDEAPFYSVDRRFDKVKTLYVTERPLYLVEPRFDKVKTRCALQNARATLSNRGSTMSNGRSTMSNARSTVANRGSTK